MDKQSEKRQLAISALSKRPPDALLAEPLEYIFADHFRQRVLCGALDEMAEQKRFDREIAGHVLAFMKKDFGIHVLDEEEDLFPLLRQRAEADDEIGEVLTQLTAEHEADRQDCEAICKLVSQAECAGGKGGELMRRFAANERHHLIVENAIVLPFAKARLTNADLESLGHQMALRRGTAYPEAG